MKANWGLLSTQNYRGRTVPRVLGIGLAALAVLGMLGAAAVDVGDAKEWGVAGGCLLVFAAGLVDDVHAIGPRGLRNHVRELVSRRMTTGILKLTTTLASAIVIVALLGRGDRTTRLAEVLLIAGCTNVWNGLDVRPGRALKGFIVVAFVLVLLRGMGDFLWFFLSLCAAAALALVLDVREKAMLGDSGSNLLGFGLGVQLAASIPSRGMWLAAATAVATKYLARQDAAVVTIVGCGVQGRAQLRRLKEKIV